MKILFKFLSVFVLVFSIWPAAFAAENALKIKKEALDIKVTDAFFYLPLGNSKSTMAFFTITNYSAVNLQVIGVSSQAAKLVRFMPEGNLALPAQHSVALKSSGRYVQMAELKTQLTTGDELLLELRLSNGQKLKVIALAKSAYDQMHSR